MTTDPMPSAVEPYEPPAVRRLGTLHELTRSGSTGTSDGAGFAGSSGTLG